VNKSHNTNWDNQNWKLRLTETECLTLNNGQLKAVWLARHAHSSSMFSKHACFHGEGTFWRKHCFFPEGSLAHHEANNKTLSKHAI